VRIFFLASYCIAGLIAAPVFAGPVASGDQGAYMDERPTQKLAFVVGNSSYTNQQSIPSSNTDAIRFAAALKNLGFTVTEVHDVKRTADFWNIKFMPFLAQIKENDFVVFFFSGHGLSYGGENFVAMVDLPKTIPESQVYDHLVAISSLRDLITSRKPGLSLFLLDSCRSIAGGIQKENGGVIDDITKGMAPIRTSIENVALGFSSDFGHVSKGRDGPEQMSYYTEALLAHVDDEGKEFSYIKRQTRRKVIADTGGEQVPWFSDSVSSEIYLKPSDQILADEKTAWSARLATGDYEQVWDFTQEYPVSRYVAAAKRWLAQHKTTASSTTKVSPQGLDNAFNLDEPNKRIVVPRVDGPFGFKTVASVASNSSATVASVNQNIGQILGQYSQVVVTRPLSARVSPDENSQTVQTVAAGSTVDIKDVAKDSSGSSWLEFAQDGSSAFLPASRALVGTADVGYSLEEIKVGPTSGLESLVDEKPIREAVADLTAHGHSISRVSVATVATSDQRLQLKLKGRVAHAFYVLQQLGIPQGQISSAFSLDADDKPDGGNDRLRIRFFGH
jgi:hypothetical protein